MIVLNDTNNNKYQQSYKQNKKQNKPKQNISSAWFKVNNNNTKGLSGFQQWTWLKESTIKVKPPRFVYLFEIKHPKLNRSRHHGFREQAGVDNVFAVDLRKSSSDQAGAGSHERGRRGRLGRLPVRVSHRGEFKAEKESRWEIIT